MFNIEGFRHNKWIRIIAYGIIIGFAFLMFLPTSISLRDIFQGSSNLITVNGQEIFHQNIPIYQETPMVTKSLADILKDFINSQETEKRMQSFWLTQVLKNPNQPSPIQKLEDFRSFLNIVINWHLNLEFAKDSGIELSNKTLGLLIENSYQKYLKNRYQERLTKITEYEDDQTEELSWEEFLEESYEYEKENYYRWGVKYLGKQYLANLFISFLQNGVLVNQADLEEEIKIQDHKVQVDFALYRYEDFLKEKKSSLKEIKGIIDEKHFDQYYQDNEEKIVVERFSFKTEREANNIKNEIKSSDENDENEKYGALRLSITAKEDKKLYNQLKKYKKGEVSKVIQKKDEEKSSEAEEKKDLFYIYKIVELSQNLNTIQKDSIEYQSLVTKYMQKNYKKYRSFYEKKAKETMNHFLIEAKRGLEFEDIIRSKDSLRSIQSGRTDFFNQNPYEITREGGEGGEVENAEDSNAKNSIKEFIWISKTGIKQYNEEFFKESFGLKVGEVSQRVLWEEAKGEGAEGEKELKKTVYFVIKKVDEKLPSLEKDFEARKALTERIQMSDHQLLSRLWLEYLKKVKGYEVKINDKAILDYLGL